MRAEAAVTTPTRVVNFCRPSRELDLHAFRRRTAEAFLLFTGRERTLRAPQRSWQLTESARSIPPVNGMLQAMPVFPLRPRRGLVRNAPDWFLTIGRAEENEIFVADVSVSVYHASIHRGERWEFLLYDAGSKNGTWVDGVRAAVKGEGPPVRLRGGVQVRFGAIRTTFLLASQLYDLARTLPGS